MGIAQRINHWSHTHQSFLTLAIRVIVGLILLFKGIFFISNSQHLRELILDSRFAAGVTFLVAYVVFAHLFGGVFIIIGLFTRIAVLLQIPVLLGALLFILPYQNNIDTGSEFILSALVLIMLIYIFIRGSGEISMEHYLKTHSL